MAVQYMRRVIEKKAKFDIMDLNCLLVCISSPFLLFIYLFIHFSCCFLRMNDKALFDLFRYLNSKNINVNFNLHHSCMFYPRNPSMILYVFQLNESSNKVDLCPFRVYLKLML